MNNMGATNEMKDKANLRTSGSHRVQNPEDIYSNVMDMAHPLQHRPTYETPTDSSIELTFKDNGRDVEYNPTPLKDIKQEVKLLFRDVESHLRCCAKHLIVDRKKTASPAYYSEKHWRLAKPHPSGSRRKGQ